jgi:hypothetical protein
MMFGIVSAVACFDFMILDCPPMGEHLFGPLMSAQLNCRVRLVQYRAPAIGSGDSGAIGNSVAQHAALHDTMCNAAGRCP